MRPRMPLEPGGLVGWKRDLRRKFDCGFTEQAKCNARTEHSRSSMFMETPFSFQCALLPSALVGGVSAVKQCLRFCRSHFTDLCGEATGGPRRSNMTVGFVGAA
jgi:hypothetical protein